MQVLKRAKKLENETDLYGPGSLMTQISHVSGSRAIMENHHIGHAVNLVDPESPLVPTGFEKVLGSKSHMRQPADADYEIMHKFMKNAYNYVIIGYDKKNKRYHAWERVEMEEHSEGFATRYKNKLIDSLEIGDVVHRGDMIKNSESFDKYGNYCLGKNLNTIYLVSLMVMEDGIAIMNGADEKMATYRSHTVTVNVNDNEIMVNLYGKNGEYQGYPDIGEKVKNGLLCAVRTIDHAKAPYALKKKQQKTVWGSDDKRYASGRVVDINIRYNKDIRDLNDTPANHRLLEYYRNQQKYYRDLYRTMDEIVRNADDEGYTYSDEFTIICEKAHAFVDSSAFFSDRNDSLFGNMSIEFTLMDKENLVVGSKMVGRYGNKGVVSTIIPNERSYWTEDGRPIEAIVAALGIVSRLNPGQLNEHDLNDLGYRAILEMKNITDLKEKGKIIHRLLKYVNSDEASAFKSYYKGLSDSQKAKFCKTVERNGIYIVQDPIKNADLLDIAEAHHDFKPVWTKIVFPDGSKSLRPVICSKMYFFRLKQDPVDKYSARSRGPINPLYDLPSKSNRKKNYQEPFADVPVRIGSQEIEAMLALCPISEVIADYMAENSTSVEMKEQQATAYYVDPDDEEFTAFSEDEAILSSNKSSKKNREIIDARCGILGTKIEIEYSYPEDGEAFEIGRYDDYWDED